MGLNEFEFIDWIRNQDEDFGDDVLVGPGDDCAVVKVAGECWLVTTDQLIDGVHVDLKKVSPRLAGRKALARAISDIAAMGGTPAWSVATVSVPAGFSQEASCEFYRGRREISDEFACPMIGGDIAVSDGPMRVSITVVGKLASDAKPILRSGAQVGDAICVTGSLGGAWLTQRHLTFCPRIIEGKYLAATGIVNSMIDISDSLSSDLTHICKSSAVGARIIAADIPISPDALAGRDNITPLQAAMGDGEDYELLFTLPKSAAIELIKANPFSPTPVSCIGTIVDASAGMTLKNLDGQVELLAPIGWEHHA